MSILFRTFAYIKKHVLPLEVAHDTNLVYQTMIKERKNGVCRIADNANCNFINGSYALMAAQAIQMYIANLNLLSSLRCDFSVGAIELTIHLEGTTLPIMPNYYLYSYMELTSHEFYSEIEKKVRRVRTITYSFWYNTK